MPPIGDSHRSVRVAASLPAPPASRGEGFGSGLVVGAQPRPRLRALRGPILAGVITASAAQDFTAGRLAVALSYAIGSALVLYALLLGGRRLSDRLSPIRGQVQAVMGALMICVAVLLVTDADTRFQTAIADDLPAFLVNPTGEIEDEQAVASSLPLSARTGRRAEEAGAGELDRGLDLPALGVAPDFAGPVVVQHRNGEALDIDELRGQVVLIDFWTYTCINCIRTLPHLKAGTRSTATTASPSSAFTRPSSRSSATPGTSPTRSSRTRSAIRWPRTTSTGPGRPTATSTGPPST